MSKGVRMRDVDNHMGNTVKVLNPLMCSIIGGIDTLCMNEASHSGCMICGNFHSASYDLGKTL